MVSKIQNLCSLNSCNSIRSSRSDAQFDETVGHIEDIIVSQEFEDLQNEFMEKHYHEFEDVEENKLVYTTIFKEYVR